MTAKMKQIEERFLELFTQNKDGIYNYAFRMLGDRDNAGDITQESFIRLYENLNNSEISNPQNWLFIITRNLCLNAIRDAKKNKSLEEITNPESVQYNNITHEKLILQKALMHLEPKFREALILKEYQGFSYNEISDILGITVSAVRALLYRARMHLKENFERFNIRGDKNVM